MKGQIDYPFLLVLVVLICSGFLIVKVSEKVSLSQKVGDLQGGLLQVNHDVLLLNAFVEDAASKVISNVFKDEPKNPSLFFPVVDDNYKCAILNTAEDSKSIFEPDIQKSVSVAVSEGLRPYLLQYMEALKFEKMPDLFEVGIEQGVLTIAALEPAVFSIFDINGVEVGQAAFRPVVRLRKEHGWDKYAASIGKLSEVALRCYQLPDPLSCARGIMPEWDPQNIGEGKVIFSPAGELNQPCYILFLPKQAEQSAPAQETPPAAGEVQG